MLPFSYGGKLPLPSHESGWTLCQWILWDALFPNKPSMISMISSGKPNDILWDYPHKNLIKSLVSLMPKTWEWQGVYSMATPPAVSLRIDHAISWAVQVLQMGFNGEIVAEYTAWQIANISQQWSNLECSKMGSAGRFNIAWFFEKARKIEVYLQSNWFRKVMNIGFVQEWGYPRTIAIVVEAWWLAMDGVTPCSIKD